MKNIFLTTTLLLLTTNLALAQSIVGNWNYTAENILFQFDPIQDNGYGVFQASYSNGYVYQNYYQVQGAQIGLAGFNNGTDQYYQLVQLDAQNLVFQDENYNHYAMVRKKTAMPQMPSTAEISSAGKVKTPYKVDDKTILARADSEVLTEGDFQQSLQLLEFLLNARLNVADLAEVKQGNIEEFQKSPAAFLKQSQEAHAQMQQLYQLTDASQIALVQSAMLAQIYPLVINDPENQDFVQLLNKYNRILAYDQANNIALTIQDVDAMINLTNFSNQLKGLQVDITEAERQKMIAEFSQNFQSLPLDQKQEICALDGIYAHFYGNYKRMNLQEQAQFRQQLLGQQANSQNTQNQNGSLPSTNFKEGTSEHLAYLSAKLDRDGKLAPGELDAYKMARQSNQDLMGMMQNMQTSSMVNSMNISEIWAGTGNYWEVVYD